MINLTKPKLGETRYFLERTGDDEFEYNITKVKISYAGRKYFRGQFIEHIHGAGTFKRGIETADWYAIHFVKNLSDAYKLLILNVFWSEAVKGRFSLFTERGPERVKAMEAGEIIK